MDVIFKKYLNVYFIETTAASINCPCEIISIIIKRTHYKYKDGDDGEF